MSTGMFQPKAGLWREAPVLDYVIARHRAHRTHEPFVPWLDRMAERGLTIDGKPFTWQGFEPLRTVYQAISDYDLVTLIKAAQMGATVMEELAMCWRADQWPGVSQGFYFPTRGDVGELSKMRFRPLAESIGALGGSGLNGRADPKTVMVFAINGSPIYMRYTEGRVSKDSIPLDGIVFDEVRLMNDADLDQIRERISGSEYGWVLSCSTAGYPDLDIDRLFKQGSMHRWLTKCSRCGYRVCMALEWPNCVAVDRDADGTEHARYVCVRCKKNVNPLRGAWVAEFPRRDHKSFHLHQMLAKHNTADKMWQAWKTTRNREEFYRAKLGVPYLDVTAVPLTLERCRAQVDPDLRWMTHAKDHSSYLGADQRGGEIHVVVLGPHPARPGDYAQRHVEVIQSDDPWVRLGEIVQQYDVDFGVVDALPSKNEAIRFAKRFPGRIFVAFYDTSDPKSGDIVRWADLPKDPARVRRGSEDVRYKYTARIARYQALGWAMDHWLRRRVWSPEPAALTQPLNVHGRNERTSVVDSHHAEIQGLTEFRHLCSVARETEMDDETGEIRKARWVNLGLDPHFLHAFTYAAVALSRAGGRPTFSEQPGATMADKLFPQAQVIPPDQTMEQIIGLATLQPVVTPHSTTGPVPFAGRCGSCTTFQPGTPLGFCPFVNLHLEPTEHPCEAYSPREPDP